MKTKSITQGLALILATAIGTTGAWAARKNNGTPPPPLSEAGNRLEASYADEMKTLKEGITRSLPKLSDRNKNDYLKSLEAEDKAKADLQEAQDRMGEIGRAEALVKHAKGKWIGGAENGIKQAREKLAKASTDAERQAAKEELAKWEKNLKEGQDALKERQAGLDKALRDKSKVEKQVAQAEKALADAKKASLDAIRDLGINSFLSSDKLDGKLAKFVILNDATPRGLATFAQQGEEQAKLIDTLLSNEDMMVQIAVADGAAGANYGRAMEIYRDIRKASPKSAEGALHRLALAVALEHATPVQQRNAVAATDAPEYVDPVKRYLHFEKAYLDKQLDPGFDKLAVWDMRMVVDGEEPDEILTWGREMLKNYRPDQVTKSDYRWRYVEIVRSDVRYGSQDNQYDEDELHFFQNILKNGGICGRRAFIGRFILRAFGIPTTARPQRGHAALAHWTPEGWVVCLGAGWGSGWTKTPYDRDLNFLATTQARATGETYKMVKRAHWIGDVMGEQRAYGLIAKTAPEFWNGVALYTQRAIIEEANAKTLAAVGEDIGEANETKEHVEIIDTEIKAEERKVTVDNQGVITVPVAAATKPEKSTGKIIFMPSVLGGTQLHYSRNGGNQDFEYTINAPSAGKYALTAKVVTPSWQQYLVLKVNGDDKAVEIPLPFTVGMWEQTDPVTVELKKGRNVLNFSHRSDGQPKGFSIREFKLAPVNGSVSQIRR
jgi:hypothetical protein